jgi:flagellar hook-length control protein FliK
MKVEAPDLDTAQAMQITAAGTATNRLQQLPVGWGQSLQNELAAIDLGAEADQISASNTGSVLNALANRLQVASPEFAQQPREQIVARLRSELLAQSSVVSESGTDGLTQKLQTAVQNMAQEAGVDVDVKVAFADFPERPANQLHETTARVANVVADENRQPLQQREKLATEAVKVDLSKAAQGLNVDNTGKQPANPVEVNTANESVTKVLNDKVADVAQTKHRHVDAESIQGKVRVEENTARAEQIVGKEAENQVAMVEANRQQALEKSNGMAQQGIEESTSKQANSALDAQFDAELTVQAEVKTEEAKFEQEIKASEQHAVQTHQLAQDELVIEEELTDEAVVASVGFVADQVVQKLQGKAADKVDEGKLADEAESVQQVEEITHVAALHAGQATASAQANVQVQTAANVGAQTSAAASVSPQANSQANVQANANATMNASGSTGNLAGQSGQSAGQNGQGAQSSGQNNGQSAGQALQNMNTAGSEQRRDIEMGARQQAQTRAADEALQKANALSSGSVDSVTGERRATLPPSMQSIPLPVRHPQWGQALGQRVNYMINSQVQQAHITLNPEKLGPIQIKLHFDREQQVQVSVLAQHGATRDAIDASIPRLREMLEQQGINLASVDVETGESFAEQQAQQDEETNSATMTATDGKGSSTVEEEQSVTTVASDSLVDYYA